jgi:hypothetical protein
LSDYHDPSQAAERPNPGEEGSPPAASHQAEPPPRPREQAVGAKPPPRPRERAVGAEQAPRPRVWAGAAAAAAANTDGVKPFFFLGG